MNTRVYLDYNATAPVRPEVRTAVEPILFGSLADGGGNASSIHWAGQAARKSLETARSSIAHRVDRKPSEVLFTSGGTEADNLALFGVMRHPKVKARRLVISAVEHPAVRAAAIELSREGVEVVEIGVDDRGQLDLQQLEDALKTPTGLVSIMAVNNETGIVLPSDEVIRLAKATETPVHIDAVQAAGRRALPLDADLLTLSGHKLGGLQGLGVLIHRSDLPLLPTTVGGPQERGKRAGTEAVAPAVGFAAAFALAEANRDAEMARLRGLREAIEVCLRSIDGSRILGESVDRVANTVTAVFEGVDGEAVLQGLDLEGVATSSGSACSSGSLEPSHVLLAMGIPGALAMTSLRFSLGWASTAEDVKIVTSILPTVVQRARS